MRHPETEATALTEVANQEYLPLEILQLDVDNPASSPRAVQEVRRFHIRVVIIEPGVIDTPAFAKPRRKSDPNSPHVDLMRRHRRIVAERLETPSPSARVSATIHHALETDQPKLRYLVTEELAPKSGG